MLSALGVSAAPSGPLGVSDITNSQCYSRGERRSTKMARPSPTTLWSANGSDMTAVKVLLWRASAQTPRSTLSLLWGKGKGTRLYSCHKRRGQKRIIEHIWRPLYVQYNMSIFIQDTVYNQFCIFIIIYQVLRLLL